jgi:hypothetical protein
MAINEEIGRQFKALTDVTKEKSIPLARGHGAFMAYNPHIDPCIDATERHSLHELGTYDDSPHDYKVHLNPADDQLFSAFTGVVDLSRQSQPFREAMYEIKVWIGGAEESEYDDVPRLVLYPRQGLEVNTGIIVKQVVPWLGQKGISGSGRVPRFNFPIVEGFCYIAQGSGSKKESDPLYLAEFDKASNRAFLLSGSSSELGKQI